jgi:hypothetical protein
VAIQGQALTVLSQHQQTGGVVNLRVHQHDSGDACIAQGPSGLQTRKGLDLLQYIGGRIHQQPVCAVGADGDGRLCTGEMVRAASAHCAALGAVAIPLWETTASGRAKHMYFQNKAAISLKKKKVCQVALTDRLISAVRDVHGDFETKTHVASCRCLPFHGVSPKVCRLLR